MPPTSFTSGSTLDDIDNGLIVVAAIALFATLTDPVGEPITAAIAGIGVALCVLAATVGVRPRAEEPTSGVIGLFLGLAGVGFVLGATRQAADTEVVFGLLTAALGAIFLWLVWRWGPVDRVRLRLLLALGLSILAVVAVAAIVVAEKPLIDVILINEAGAAALADGENPYVTASIPNTSPIVADGATFDGYTYPPIALVIYSLSEWVAGDVRWANVLAIALFILVLAWPWLRSAGPVPALVVVAVGTSVLLPVLGFLLRYGWTEPIALPFLAGAALTWQRRPILSAILLGLALATKQYFVLLAPLVLFWADDYRFRRLAIVGGVVAATMVPFVIQDPVAFWEASIAPSLEASARPDSINLVAFGTEPPQWLATVLAMISGVVLGRRGGGGAAFAIASAAVLGLAFFFGFQAFVNYWYLILSLGLVALVAGLPGAPDRAEVGVASRRVQPQAR